MDCLNREEIQPYLDSEVSSKELESFRKHMLNCNDCSKLWEDSKKEIKNVQELICLTQLGMDLIELPAFTPAKHDLKNSYWLRYSSIAAGILVFICIYQYQSALNQKSERIARTKMEIERNLYESDQNKLWNEKKSIITIIDADGNLIYMND